MDKIVEVKVGDIKVKEGRRREDFGDIQGLADSIESVGQIIPILINENYFLIAGERRLRAHKLLKKETIQAIIRSADELNQEIIEIVENLERKDFTWQEQVLALERLHEILMSKNKEWSIADTFKEVNQSEGKVRQDLELAKILKEQPLIFEGCKSKKDAQILMKKLLIDETLSEIRKRADSSTKKHKASNILFHGNCLDLIRELKDASINAIISDPFYGINIDETKRHLSARGETIYDDSPDVYTSTMKELISHFPRVSKPDSCVVLFCAIQHFHLLHQLLSDVGYQCDIHPALWIRGGSAGQILRPELYFARCYELFIYGHRGSNTLLKQGQPNIFAFDAPRGDKLHPVQKPLILMEEIIKRFCLPGATVLDPFAGSATTLVAAIKRGLNPIGFELEERYYNMGLHRINNALAAKEGGNFNVIE